MLHIRFFLYAAFFLTMSKRFYLLFVILNISLLAFSQEAQSDDFQTESSKVSIEVVKTEELPYIQKFSRQTKKYKELGIPDPYETFSKEVEENYKLIAGKKLPKMSFYLYENNEFKTILQLAARCNLTYETLATLNKIPNATENIIGKTFLIPTCPGIFLHTSQSKSDLEILLFENYNFETLTKNKIWYNIDSEDLIFLPNQKLSPTERAYFLDCSLQLPIPKDSFWISSDFGTRKNPFSGEIKNHKGIDLAAAEGTPVFAIKDGTVAVKVHNDSTFGNYIILSHDKGKLTSVYAHLKSTEVEQNEYIKKGKIIGYVGKTGMATGAHLHFEIRKGGIPKDPSQMLKF